MGAGSNPTMGMWGTAAQDLLMQGMLIIHAVRRRHERTLLGSRSPNGP